MIFFIIKMKQIKSCCDAPPYVSEEQFKRCVRTVNVIYAEVYFFHKPSWFNKFGEEPKI